MSAEPTIRLEVADAIATVTLDRPAALNALTVPMKRDLLGALQSAECDRAVRAVILTGAGRAFCAGQDLHERLQPDAAPLGEELRERYNPIVRAMRGMSKPIIGAINGVAAGAGASLAFACDIRIAADGATFALAFGRVGLVPDTGATWLLPRLVGGSRATQIAMLNTSVTATEALAIGLVAAVVPGDALAETAREMAGRLAVGAPIALGLTKQALHAAWELDFEGALELEAELQDRAGQSEDHAEGIDAFMAKRPPRFSGT